MKRHEGIIFDIDTGSGESGSAGEPDVPGTPLKPPCHHIVREVLENPESPGGWIFGMVSIGVTWMSILTATMETVPYFTHDQGSGTECWYWCAIEMVINTWFLVEFVLRLMFAKVHLKINYSSFFTL